MIIVYTESTVKLITGKFLESLLQIQIQIQIMYWIKYMYIIITMLRNPIHSQAYINIEITHNIIILSLQIRL